MMAHRAKEEKRKGRFQTDEITGEVINASITIHNKLGPGLFESIYEHTLVYELRKRGLRVAQQVALPVYYEDIKLDIGFRADLIVEDEVIVEIKSVESIHPVHKKQVLSYLRLAHKRIGLLINFNEELLKEGITRLFN